MFFLSVIIPIVGIISYFNEIWWLFYVSGIISIILFVYPNLIQNLIRLNLGGILELLGYGICVFICCKVCENFWHGLLLGSCIMVLIALVIALISLFVDPPV